MWGRENISDWPSARKKTQRCLYEQKILRIWGNVEHKVRITFVLLEPQLQGKDVDEEVWD